jgi:hypothetical protein
MQAEIGIASKIIAMAGSMRSATVMRLAAPLVILLGLNSRPAHAGPSLIGTATTASGQTLTAGEIAKVVDVNHNIAMFTLTKPGIYSINTTAAAASRGR